MLFPSLSYFAGLGDSDLLLIVDVLPHRRRTRVTRASLPGGRQLVMPVSGKGRHCDLRFPEDGQWRRKFLRTLDHAYAGSPFHAALREDVGDAVADEPTPVALNLALIRIHLRALRLRTKLAVVSQGTANASFDGAAQITSSLEEALPSALQFSATSLPPGPVRAWAEAKGCPTLFGPDLPKPPLAYTLLVEEGADARHEFARIQDSSRKTRRSK